MSLVPIALAFLTSAVEPREVVPIQVVQKFIAAYGRKDFKTAAKYVQGANPNAKFSRLKQLKAWPKFAVSSLVVSEVRGSVSVDCTLQVQDPGEKPLKFQDRVRLRKVGKDWKIVPLKATDNGHDLHIINTLANLIVHPESIPKSKVDAGRF